MSSALRIACGEFGRVALLDMDRSLIRHAHPHCHVLLKVEGADTQFVVGSRIVPLSDRTAVLVNGWQMHAYQHRLESPNTLILALYIEPAWLNLFRSGWLASGSPGFFQQPSGEITPRIRRLAHDLAAEMMCRPGARSDQKSLLCDLMIAVIERFSQWSNHPRSIRSLNSSTITDPRIRRIVTTMQEDDKNTMNVIELARKAGLSRAHFFRMFEASTNVSPRVYFNVLRMERAVDANIGSDDNVADVGERLGFGEPAHFSRFFRDHAGVAPSEFRSVARFGGHTV